MMEVNGFDVPSATVDSTTAFSQWTAFYTASLAAVTWPKHLPQASTKGRGWTSGASSTTAARWSEGDWNGDGVFDSGDFVTAFQDGGYEQVAAA